ncbi:hypothetical protein [Geodermatophilus sp. DSM 44513]|uniref:hypothetical protein n=1 Tax=Geodermatophilus sp. DSM 44513 TaxID=1528104 RepID=UPI0014121D31|nr:hypothetical protein [Geodermatophilus sp. DSM 44513]WNV75184.1 hypothetical protein RTG05_19685 [Geodermatophilus sp. DSM 44513]
MLEAVDDRLLPPADEARRRQLVRKQDRDDFTAARMVGLLLMGFLHGAPATEYEIHQLCDVCGGRHGRPAIPNPSNFDVSWSHDQGVVAAGVGPGRIGVDVLASARSPRVRDLRSSGLSNPSIETITRAEALVKVGAGGLADLIHEAAHRAAPEPTGEVYVSDNNQRVRLQRMDVDDAIVSVASTHYVRPVFLDNILP